jgi:hypothetical protein
VKERGQQHFNGIESFLSSEKKSEKKNRRVREKEEVSARRRNNGSDVVDIFSYLELDFPIEEAVPENFSVVSGPAAMIVGTADEARRSCRVRDTRRRCCSSLF